ncbi:MAG: GDP-mannose 4,6-dehydratase [Candidatus Eisenbacteria bacterium]|nr:GDP-mannose 4,6-dehydratase [Candidatus Eisenbacteria bacterium]
MSPGELNGRSVLVTGAAGFVGPHLARALVARGATVHGCGLGTPPAGTPLASWRERDLGDADGLRETLRDTAPAGVIHLAGQSSAARSFEAPEETLRANVAGTWNLLDAIRRQAPRARVIVVGTSESYGPCEPGTRLAEDAPFRPVSPYALSKATADQMAESFAREHGLDVVRARPFGHTGPGQTDRFVVPGWAKQIAEIEAGRAEPVLRVGNLDVTRDLSDVRDIVLGYVALLERGTGGAAYNLCRGEGAALTEVLAKLLTLARVPIRHEQDPARLRPADVPYLVGDPSRVARECGWRVTRSLEETLRDVLEDWRGRLAR